MKKVTASEIVMGIIFVVIGLSGVDRGAIYYWGVSSPFPRQFGWAFIVLGVGIPVAAFIMRSRQNKDK